MLKEKIKEDLKQAMKQKDKDGLRTLRLLSASIKNKEKEKRYQIAKRKKGLGPEELDEKSELTDAEVLEVLSSEVKKRRESIEEFRKGEREDLVQKEKVELEIIKKYLPEELSPEEVEKKAEEAIEKVGAEGMKDMGRVMNVLMPQMKGRAEGALVSKIVKKLLCEEG